MENHLNFNYNFVRMAFKHSKYGNAAIYMFKPALKMCA